MKRIIVGIEKLTPNILNLFVNKFPEGYGDNDIIEFKNANGETIKAVELKSEDTIYLVKIGKRMTEIIQEFEEDNDEEFDDDPEIIEPDNDMDENVDFDMS